MKKHHFILLLLLGMFLLPANAIACNGKSACKKEMSKGNTQKKSCCEGDKKSDDSQQGCEGNCGHANCGCSASAPAPSLVFLPEINFKVAVFSKAFISKAQFSYTTPSISDGFSSIWLIPKIG